MKKNSLFNSTVKIDSINFYFTPFYGVFHEIAQYFRMLYLNSPRSLAYFPILQSAFAQVPMRALALAYGSIILFRAGVLRLRCAVSSGRLRGGTRRRKLNYPPPNYSVTRVVTQGGFPRVMATRLREVRAG